MGGVEPGKAADLVLLNEDPMMDMDCVGQVTLVITAGRIVPP